MKKKTCVLFVCHVTVLCSLCVCHVTVFCVFVCVIWLCCVCVCHVTRKRKCPTVADDHAGLQRLVGEGLVADAAGPLVHVEEAAHTVPRAVQVVQPRLPQRRPGERIQ